jgi:hypothetical protein
LRCMLVDHDLFESHYWSGGSLLCKYCDYHKTLWTPIRTPAKDVK